MTDLSDQPATANHDAPRRRWPLLIGGGLALVLVAWLLVALWLPGAVKSRIESEASKALGAPVTMDRLTFSPWHLRATLQGLRLGPTDAPPWFALAAAEVDVSLSSLWHRAPVIERLTLQQPALHLERLAADRYNISPLLDALAQRPPAPKDAQPARFAVHNIRIEGGTATLKDQLSHSEQRIEGLRLGIPFLSNLPTALSTDVEPLLDATINGAPLHLDGRTQPFSQGQRSALHLHWQAVDLSHWLAAMQPLLTQALPVTLQQGALDLDVQVAFERRTTPPLPSLHITGAARVSALQASVPAQGLQASWDSLALEGLDLRPLEQHAHIGSVTLTAPDVRADLPTVLGHNAMGAPRAEASRAALAAASSAAAASTSTAVSGHAPSATAWHWQVDTVTVARGRVALHDPAWPEPNTLKDIALTATGLHGGLGATPATTSPGARADTPRDPARFKLTLADGRQAQMSAEGTLDIDTQQASVSLGLADWQAVPWLAPWRAALQVGVSSGTVSAQAKAQVQAGRWQVQDGTVHISGLQVSPSASASAVARETLVSDRLDIAKITLSGLDVQSGATTSNTARGTPALAPLTAPLTAGMTARLAALRLEGLDLRGTRSKNGQLAWLGTPGNQNTPVASTPSAAAQPVWQVDEITCQGCALTVSDQSVTPAATLALHHTELTLKRLGSDAQVPLTFQLNTATTSKGEVKDKADRAAPSPARAASIGGRIKASGTLRRLPLEVRSRLDIDSLDLALLRPYLDPYLNLTLAAARLNTAGDLSLDGTAREAVSAARWRGRLALADLRTLDRLNAAEFLRFKGLSLDGADLQWRPAGVEADLGQVALTRFYGRVIVNSDGRVNLRDIVRSGQREAARSLTTTTGTDSGATAAEGAASGANRASGASAPLTSAATPVSATAAPKAPTPIRWRGIQLSDGQVDFTDNFIRPNYSARITRLTGEISALAWNDPQPAQIKLAGLVDDSAPLTISGTVHPLGARLQTDVTADVRGIDITRLSAYAARYAGYGIDKGTLSAKVHYKIDQGQLQADNQLYLDQLTFGAKVDSPSALKLPVQLAVSLLKDRHGVIDLQLPISGSLDDPQFSVAGVVGHVLVNLISKAVTAPFTLLGQVFGGGGQQLSHVVFTPGTPELSDAATATLATLAKALTDRPALKLDITGQADTALDTPALRVAHVDQLLRAAKAKATGEALDDVTIDAAERSRWLEAVYKATDLKGKPRNAVGLQKTLPEAEMQTALEQTATIGPDALKTLADDRAERVKAWLAAKVASERLLVTASQVDGGSADDTSEGNKSAAAQVRFTLR